MSERRADPGLMEFLSNRARHASDTRLALDAAGGVVIALAAVLWRPAGWALVVGLALCFAAYGGWGMADRELGERKAAGAPTSASSVRVVRTLRVLAAIIGFAAGLAVLFRLFALALGTWIS